MEQSVEHINMVAVKKDVPFQFKECTCRQDPKTIQCHWCGYSVVGRVRKICQMHPRIIHLMDMVVCPKCRGTLN
ncbi:Hypothetical predicted protein [Paramuricea clavata]|uniref:Uncharacterized protein n=1 Tax=Paramuricea clavata TaxID=317549 RepID=A0A7D9E752_PARCT|nr:Hypothetical predicted protein [Paramuricea clavata]